MDIIEASTTEISKQVHLEFIRCDFFLVFVVAVVVVAVAVAVVVVVVVVVVVEVTSSSRLSTLITDV